MEIEGEDGSKLELQNGYNTVFGRGTNYDTDDKTVARKHVSFELNPSSNNQTDRRVSFTVIGKNPLWLRSKDGDGRWNVKAFRRFEKGEMAAGDWFCVSSHAPVWFSVKCRSGDGDGELSRDFEVEGGSEIDPVREFGFLVIGHEFDSYPKQRVRDVKDWDWFLEEPERDSEDDDSLDVKKNRRKRKNKKRSGENDDDDDWTGDSEEDKDIVTSSRKVGRPKYDTRSADRKRPHKDSKRATSSKKKRNIKHSEDGEEYDDEEDETLGGFIVDEDETDEGEEAKSDEEEEEFIDDDEVLDD